MIFPLFDPNTFSVIGMSTLIIALLFSLFGAIFALNVPFIYFLLPRRFDPKFQYLKWEYNQFIRSSCYVTAMTIPKWVRKASLIGRISQEYDLLANATKFERVIAYIHTTCMLLAVLMAIIFGILYLIYCIPIWMH